MDYTADALYLLLYFYVLLRSIYFNRNTEPCFHKCSISSAQHGYNEMLKQGK